MDAGLVSDGLRITDDYMSFLVDGTFSVVHDGGPTAKSNTKNHGKKHAHKKTKLPVHVTDRGPAQVLVSDYTLDSLINTSLDLNWYDFTQTMNGDAIDDYIKGFASAFGSWTDCEVSAKLVKG